MRAHHPTHLITVTLFAWACGSSNGESNLTHYGDELSESVVSVEAALAAHHEAVLAETDLSRMQDMERMHMDQMGMRMDCMQDAQDSMATCGEHMQMADDAAAARSFHDARGAMAETIDEAAAELARHSQAMQDAQGMSDAITEERAHQTAMAGVMERMRTHDADLGEAMQAMNDAGMSMMCPMRSHMHRER